MLLLSSDDRTLLIKAVIVVSPDLTLLASVFTTSCEHSSVRQITCITALSITVVEEGCVKLPSLTYHTLRNYTEILVLKTLELTFCNTSQVSCQELTCMHSAFM